MKMEFRFLGGAEMVGRMGMTMSAKDKTMLVEYGMSPTKPPEYPLQCPKVDHVFLTHCHLDHCGMIPNVCGRGDMELFTTALSAEIGEIMMYDSLKIAKAENFPPPYTTGDIERTMRNVVPLEFGDVIDLDNIEVTMHSAGHIPGASMFEFGVDTSTLYSGDIHTIKQRLVDEARPVKCENLFIEGTYGGRTHPDRMDTERAFLNKIKEVNDRGGIVLIPSFATGRTQEIMLLLRNLNYEMWVDGMSRSVTGLYMNYPEYLRDFKKMKAAKRKFTEVRNAGMRSQAKKADVIVTTGGMMDGGPILNYLREFKDNPKNAILMVGYQAEDTNGRMLEETGTMMLDGVQTKIHCEVQKYSFSAHADHQQLVQFVHDCKPENVVIMHSETRELFLKDLQDYNVILPKTGEAFTLDV